MSSQTDELLNMPGPGGGLPILSTTPAPLATPPTSSIDPTIPVFGQPTTQSVRDNFATAATEITALMQATQGGPFMPIAGGHFSGPMYLYNDPTDVMMPVTLGYFNAHGGGGSGGGGIPEAPADGRYYTRSQGAWVPGVALPGGSLSQMAGELLLAANPTSALGATPKQYVDAIATTANAAVPLAGGTMTGLLILSGDPAAALGAATKQYVDAADALRAPINNPTFTGIMTTTGGRIIVTTSNAPSLTLNNTTFNSPVFGLANSGNLFQIGIANAATGNLTGTLAMMDNAGNWTFGGRINATSGRLIASSSNNPSIALNNTGGGGQIWGLWSASSGTLAMGRTDANGTPGASPLAQLDTAGNLSLNGDLNLGNNAVGFVPASGNVLNISGPLGANLASIGLFANNVTIANNGNLNCGVVSCGAVQGGASNAGTLRCWGTNDTVNFQWGSGQLTYRIDESIAKQICTATNAKEFGYASSGGPTGVSLNGYDNAGDLFGIFVDAQSDASIKENIADSAVDALALIRRLRLRSFDYTAEIAGDPHVDLGLVAQEVAEVIPAMVPDMPFADGLKRINLKAAVPYLIRAVQQLAEGKK